MLRHTRALVIAAATATIGTSLMLGVIVAPLAGATTPSFAFCAAVGSSYTPEAAPALGPKEPPSTAQVSARNSWVTDHNDMAQWIIENAPPGTYLDHIGARFAKILHNEIVMSTAFRAYIKHPIASNKAVLIHDAISANVGVAAATNALDIALLNVDGACPAQK